MSDFLGFFTLINAISGGGNKGNAIPQDDLDDFKNGASYIPEEVTIARRKGEKVVYDSVKKIWTMPDGKIVR